MKQDRRARLVTVAILALVLGTGFLLGMAWDRAGGLLANEAAEEEDEARAEREEDDDRNRGGRRERRLIVHGVGITPEQNALVDSIVDRHGDRVRTLRRTMEDEYDPRFRALRREMEAAYDPHFEAILMETRASIRSVLSQDQAATYDSLLAEHDRKEAERAKRREDGGR